MGEKRFIADPSPWVPISDAKTLKVMGKFSEELGGLAEAIIGTTGIHPKVHFENVTKEIADVLCNIELDAEHLAIDMPVFHGKIRAAFPTAEIMRSVGGCVAAVARCIIQGVDEAEPSTGKINRDWLREAMIEVRCSCAAVINEYRLDSDVIMSRMTFKRGHLTRWHQMEISA